jgi:hypothetical protein
MGGLKKLFGLGGEAPSPQQQQPQQSGPPGEDLGAALMRLTRTYWTRAPDELSRLQSEVSTLAWPKLLRLHHLVCLELLHATGALKKDSLSAELPNDATGELYLRTAARLQGAGSPYLPRNATVIQRPRGTVQLPPRQGELRNASSSHHGALEVIRLNKDNHPVALEFFAYQDLAAIALGPPSLFPPAKVMHRDGREEVVCLPLLYGASWFSEEPSDQNGSMTRFSCHHKDVTGGIGLGHQDFMSGGAMFGLGSVMQIDFGR